MLNIYDPLHMMQPEDNHLKGMTDEECIKICILQAVSFFAMLFVLLFILAVISLFTGCTTPKAIEQHRHHQHNADTLAVQAQADKHLNNWHTQMDSSWRQSWHEHSASLSSHDNEKETITETITTYIDSIGREVRQEQRTIDRSLSRMQQQTEQRLSREFEQRMSVVVDSLNDIWQQRFDVLQAHYEQADSTASSVQSAGVFAGDNIPWYKHWWQSLKDYLLIAAIIIILWITRNIWLPWCINIFRRA